MGAASVNAARRTDMTKVISALYNYRKTPKKTLYFFIEHKL